MNTSARTRLERKQQKIAREEEAIQKEKVEAAKLQEQLDDRWARSVGWRLHRGGVKAMTEEQLDGFIRSGVAAMGDEKKLASFARISEVARAREEAEKSKVREELVIMFPGRPDDIPESLRAALGEKGFKYNKFVRHWEGDKASFEEARVLAAAVAGGRVERVNEPAAEVATPMAAE
jgi:hypothetical protein